MCVSTGRPALETPVTSRRLAVLWLHTPESDSRKSSPRSPHPRIDDLVAHEPRVLSPSSARVRPRGCSRESRRGRATPSSPACRRPRTGRRDLVDLSCRSSAPTGPRRREGVRVGVVSGIGGSGYRSLEHLADAVGLVCRRTSRDGTGPSPMAHQRGWPTGRQSGVRSGATATSERTMESTSASSTGASAISAR